MKVNYLKKDTAQVVALRFSWMTGLGFLALTIGCSFGKFDPVSACAGFAFLSTLAGYTVFGKGFNLRSEARKLLANHKDEERRE